MFDSLSDRLEGIFSRLRGRGRLNEKDVEDVAREIRLALLEADVNVRVVRAFIGRIKERAVGEEVMKSLSPAQQVIKIVHEELAAVLGGARGWLLLVFWVLGVALVVLRRVAAAAWRGLRSLPVLKSEKTRTVLLDPERGRSTRALS